jgi:hypothetical protein
MQLYYKKLAVLLAAMLSVVATSYVQGQQAADVLDIDDRLRYLNSGLTDIQRPSAIWQYGWTGFYGISGVAQLAGAIGEDDNDDATVLYIGAVKSLGGLTMLLVNPLPVVRGLDELNQLPQETQQQKVERLAAAERMLQESAKRADERYTIKAHLIGLVVNLLGAGAIAAWGDKDDALGATALGIAINEAAIWSQPSAAEKHWQNYQRRFNGVGADSVDWRIVPGLNSVTLQITF